MHNKLCTEYNTQSECIKDKPLLPLCVQVKVFQSPRVAVLSTGNEVGYILVSFPDHTQEPGNETSHCYISFLLNIKHNKPSIASKPFQTVSALENFSPSLRDKTQNRKAWVLG